MQAIVGLLLGVLIIYYVPTAIVRTIDRETKLGIFEAPVEGVATEFMRRSPALKANWEEFRICARTHGCDYSRILKERDVIIAREWPEVFDRVSVRNDWWHLASAMFGDDVAGDKELFFGDLERYGRAKLRDSCVPLITYRFDRLRDATTFTTDGFNCQPGRLRSG